MQRRSFLASLIALLSAPVCQAPSIVDDLDVLDWTPTPTPPSLFLHLGDYPYDENGDYQPVLILPTPYGPQLAIPLAWVPNGCAWTALPTAPAAGYRADPPR